MKTVKFQLQCDYCEKKSRNYIFGTNSDIEADSWKQTLAETICPNCQTPRDYPADEIGNRLKDVFKFKNLTKTARAFSFQPQTMTNLNNGAAGAPIKNFAIAVIAMANELSLKKRRAIIKNIDYILDK